MRATANSSACIQPTRKATRHVVKLPKRTPLGNRSPVKPNGRQGVSMEACRLGIDTFDVPLLSEWVQHIGVCHGLQNR